jgi:hypothetical protein
LLPWSAAIASVLLGLTAGHALGGVLGGARANASELRADLAMVWCAGGLAALAMPAGVTMLAQHGLFGDIGASSLAPLCVAALAFAPSLAAGCVAPLVIRVALATPGLNVPRVVAHTYAASAAGSVVGTAAAGFLLLEWIGSHGLVLAIGALWFLLAALVLPWRTMRPQVAVSVAIAAVAVAAVLAASASAHNPCLTESRYTCLRLFDRALAGGGLARFMQLDEGVHSASDRDDPARLHLGYTAVVDRLAAAAMAASAAPRAFVIGGGGATLPRAWAHAAHAANVTVVELDAVVAESAAAKMWATPGPRLATVLGDGRAALRAAPAEARYDVILMDAYRTRSVPPHLVTREFDRLVRAHLAPSGVFLANVIDRWRAPLLAASVAATLALEFPAVDIWVGDDGEDEVAQSNIVVAAWRDATRAERPQSLTLPATLMRAGGEPYAAAVTWRRVDVKALRAVWPGLCPLILIDDRAPVDRLLTGRVQCKNP